MNALMGDRWDYHITMGIILSEGNIGGDKGEIKGR